jgi:aryl-alcohol dehydrogenase-like predicted oxidoreductase
MTFGKEWGWGADAGEARRIFDLYIDRGGNFVDTSVNYTGGSSERLLGTYIKEKRDRVVVATKFTMAREPGNPNAGGNHRLNIIRSVEDSLRQLDTDWIDLLYLHGWDYTTAPDEVMRGLDDLVSSGKVVYLGISNAPAWRVAEMQTLADLRGWAPFVALQVEYNLISRTVEHEQIPMAAALGLGVLPWSPLAGGILSGKYSRADLAGEIIAGTRKEVIVATSNNLNERAFAITEVVCEIAAELNVSPSQVAIAWTLQNQAVVSPIIGARTVAQAEDNLNALAVTFTADQLSHLNNVSAIEPIFPYSFTERPAVQHFYFGGAQIEERR